MKEKEITIAGKQVTLGYCFATEIAYKNMAGEVIDAIIQESIAWINTKPERKPDIERSIYLVLAAVMAYYKSKGEEAPIKDTDLMNDTTPSELGTAIGTIVNLWYEFYTIPKGEPEDKPQEGKGKGKN